MSKAHVLHKHPGAIAEKNAAGWWDVVDGLILLGQGKTATCAWWDATKFTHPEWTVKTVNHLPQPAAVEAAPAPATNKPPGWPFPVSAHNWSAVRWDPPVGSR